MIRPWILSLWLCLLWETANAFPSNGVALANGDLSSTALHLSFPSIPAFRFPVAAQKKQQQHQGPSKAKGLWYRDRSSEEEQWTTPSPRPSIQRTETKTSQTLVSSSKDWNILGKVNLPMVKETCLSHAKLLAVGSTVLAAAMLITPDGCNPSALHWNGDMTPFHSLLDWTLTPWRVIEGIVATVPLVALTKVVCESDHSELCPVHFSVSNSVLSLFGRRQSQDENTANGTTLMTVLLVSVAMAAVSAVSEEVIFRGMLPAVLESWSHSVEFALLGQAFLFGMGQIRRQSSATENSVFSLMHFANALWYGAVYLGTGGDIMPVLIAHILYECHIFVGVWKMVNDQLDYTELQKAAVVSAKEQQELDVIRQQAGDAVKPETLDGCRRFFYAFDQERKGSLSLADVKRAVAFAFLRDPMAPSDAQTKLIFEELLRERSISVVLEPEEEDRINLSEFLRLLFALKSSKTTSSVAWNQRQFA